MPSWRDSCVAAVVDAAAGHDLHIAVLADVEVVVHRLLHTGLGDDDGDVAGLALGARPECGCRCRPCRRSRSSILMCSVDCPAVTAAVLADVEGPHGLTDAGPRSSPAARGPSRVSIIQLHLLSSAPGSRPAVSARIWGRISSAVPRWRDRAVADHDDLVRQGDDALLVGDDDHGGGACWRGSARRSPSAGRSSTGRCRPPARRRSSAGCSGPGWWRSRCA